MTGELITWSTKQGNMIVQPERGRVLQAAVQGHDALWVNAFWRKGWNVGGDRLWCGPENSWFWQTKGEPDFGKYEVSKAMDSDNWKTVFTGDNSCVLSKKLTLHHQTGEASVRLELSRSFALSTFEAPYFDHFIAYTTDNRLEIRGGTPGQKVDLWSSLQVPPGGIVYVSFRGEASFRNYLDPITDDLWEKRRKVLAFEITGQQLYKVGVPVGVARGRMAYVREVNGDFLVVYREFYCQPWRDYCDCPLDESGTKGDVIQVFNDDGTLGHCGEMDYHSPCLITGSGPTFLTSSNYTAVGLIRKQNWSRWYNYWLLCEED